MQQNSGGCIFLAAIAHKVGEAIRFYLMRDLSQGLSAFATGEKGKAFK